ncbi:hypothetical protein [Rathayibacter sp. Leaf296]|uniref:hypothetical protein n=1 Tax=Rathayibacter sp. Leaf296 TaxID=1736327 RepID=UPI0007036F25|nr:hypothetical protein [Rathayibacter sp. Leaf296]KQQ08037.1 hypothetical protein ASF46_11780 [Rathayibacter sp. Leaf296]
MTRSSDPTASASDDSSWLSRASDGSVQRRTIVAGAAWTIPVVAAAAATPAAAASLTPTLEFANGPYSVSACGTLSDVVIHATTDGTVPAVGLLVTVTLPAGLEFPDGTTTKAFTTDTNGHVVLTGIAVSSTASSGSIGAASTTLTATEAVVVAGGGTTAYRNYGGGASSYVTVPSGSTAVGNSMFLSPDGDLYFADSVIATDVQSVTYSSTHGGANDYGYVTGSGAYYYDSYGPGAAGLVQQTNVPVGSTAIGPNVFLSPDGDLYEDNAIIATDVATANYAFIINPAPQDRSITYTKTDGTAHRDYGGVSSFATVPSGSTAVGNAMFLSPDGDLYFADSVIATDVQSVAYSSQTGAENDYGYVTSTGAYYYDSYGPGAAGLVLQTNVPVGSTAIGPNVFLSPDGDLYEDNAIIATNVTTANYAFIINPAPQDRTITYTAGVDC